jgi:hypothetical protein
MDEVREVTFSILTTHSTGAADGSPLRYVTEDQLERYEAAQRELDDLKATDAVRLVIRLRRWLAWLLVI